MKEVNPMDLDTLLEQLTTPAGVTGKEESAAEIAAKLLDEKVDEVYKNNRGSIVGIKKGVGPKILLDAHLDQVGYIVTDIADNGFIKFDQCGGPDDRICSGLEVTILGKKSIYGVISSIPPHLADPKDAGKAKKESELAIDTGLTKEDCEKYISLGDRVVANSSFQHMLGTQVSARALDDRSGIAVLLRALDYIQEKVKQGAPQPNLYIQFTVQEEVGGNGAATAAFDSQAEEAIAVDVSFAWTPGCKKEETKPLGSGPMIGVAPVLNYAMFENLKQIAESNDIPYTVEVMTRRTGTHADELAVTKAGIPTALVSFPLKYMHTPVEIIDTRDVEQTAKLIAEYCLQEAAK